MATVAEIHARLEDADWRAFYVRDRIKDENLRRYTRFASDIFRTVRNYLSPSRHPETRSPEAIQWWLDQADGLVTQGLAYVEYLEAIAAKDAAEVELVSGRSRAARGRALGAKRPKPQKRLRPSG